MPYRHERKSIQNNPILQSPLSFHFIHLQGDIVEIFLSKIQLNVTQQVLKMHCSSSRYNYITVHNIVLLHLFNNFITVMPNSQARPVCSAHKNKSLTFNCWMSAVLY